MAELSFRVPEMHCGACEQAIRTAVTAVPGVTGLRADVTVRTVTVTYTGADIDPGTIRGAIEGAGFDVE
jgi:copper chaperone